MSSRRASRRPRSSSPGRSPPGSPRSCSDAIPPYETTFSFPSGHSLNALVLAGILGLLVIRYLWRTSWPLKALTLVAVIAYSASMGLSRVYLGHHWLTDVLAAWLVGLGWLALVIACHRVWRQVRRRTEPTPIEEERTDSPAVA